MIRWMSSLPAAAALLMLNGVAAFGQSELKFDVPFTFHTSGTTMAPGKYHIVRVATHATPYYKLRHEGGKSVLVFAAYAVQRRGELGKAEVAFECAGEYCALKAIYPAFDATGVAVPMKIKPGFRAMKTAEIRIPTRP